MSIHCKINLQQRLDSGGPIFLELGCGSNKRDPLAVGVDILDCPGVDIVGDIFEVLASFPNKCVDAVYSSHFIEHVSDIQKLLAELARIVKENGELEFLAPHFSNPYFYSDPTHRTFFGLYTFCYYADSSPFSRKVPNYGYEFLFKLKKIDLIFKSARPFFLRYAFKRLFGSIFNSSNYLKEWYEENICFIFPCYEVRYILIRKK
jgi:ubiquinone/menaquinone biosynthesis C-methylase UbiE